MPLPDLLFTHIARPLRIELADALYHITSRGDGRENIFSATMTEYRDRNSAIIAAFRSGGYSMREIGDHVRLHYSRISRIIKLEQKARSKT